MNPSYQKVVCALEQQGIHLGNSGKCRCPSHDDRNPSLSVSEGNDGRVLLYCHAGCDTEKDVVPSLGLTMADLQASDFESSYPTRLKPAKRNPGQSRGFPTADECIRVCYERFGSPDMQHIYHDKDSEEIGRAIRWGSGPGKEVRFISKQGGQWVAQHLPKPRPLYCLPDILSAFPGSTICVAEGEKAVDALRSIGLLATTSIRGSGAAEETDWSPLNGLRVVMLPDNDEKGEGYANDVKGLLGKMSPGVEWKVLRLPGLKAKGDAYDFIETLDAVESESIREQILGLADAIPFEHIGEPAAIEVTETPIEDRAVKTPMASALPEDIADEFIEANLSQGVSKYRFWNSNFYRFNGYCFHEVTESDMRAEVINFARARYAGVKSQHIANVLLNLQATVKIADDKPAPCWAESPGDEDMAAWKPEDVIVLKGQLLHVPSYIEAHAGEVNRERKYLVESTAAFFSLSHVNAVFNDEAKTQVPRKWLAFLEQSIQDDERIRALQQFAGYLLTTRTHLHRALFIVGPTRGGKSVFVDVLSSLVGDKHVAATSLGSLGTQFGLQSLLEKSLLTISDARLPDKINTLVVERLLNITGEDRVYIDRKGLPPLSQKLNTRIVIATNEIPTLKDAAGALAARLLVVRFPKSFAGHENRSLRKELEGELPGILQWALEGLASLDSDGDFSQPSCDIEVLDQFKLMTSDVRDFVNEKCLVGPEFECEKGTLYRAFQEFMLDSGYTQSNIPVKSVFCRELTTSFLEVKPKRKRVSPVTNERVNVFVGITLRQSPDSTPTWDGVSSHVDCRSSGLV